MGTFVCTYAGQILNEDMANKVERRDFISFIKLLICHPLFTYKNCAQGWIIHKQNNFTLDLLEEKEGFQEDLSKLLQHDINLISVFPIRN